MQPSAAVLLFVAAGLTAGVVGAQQARDDGGAARLQGMVQQLTADKTQLQTDNKKLKTDLDAVNAELKKMRDDKARLETRASQAEASVSQSNVSNTRATAQLEQQRTRMEELVAQFRQTIESLRATELERNDLKTTLASRQNALDQCVASNQKMFETGNEVLDRLEARGRFAAWREKEPFTHNKRVELENLVDQYRWSLDDQHLPRNKTAPPPADSAASGGT